jgi:hypothetical protein
MRIQARQFPVHQGAGRSLAFRDPARSLERILRADSPNPLVRLVRWVFYYPLDEVRVPLRPHPVRSSQVSAHRRPASRRPAPHFH